MQTNDPILAGIARLCEVRQKRQQELDDADAPRKKREQEVEENWQRELKAHRAQQIRDMEGYAAAVSRILLGEDKSDAPEYVFRRVYGDEGSAALRCRCLRQQRDAPFNDEPVAVYDPSLEAAAAACAAAGHASHPHYMLDERVRGADLAAAQARWNEAHMPAEVWPHIAGAIRAYMASPNAGRAHTAEMPAPEKIVKTLRGVQAELAKHQWAFSLELRYRPGVYDEDDYGRGSGRCLRAPALELVFGKKPKIAN